MKTKENKKGISLIVLIITIVVIIILAVAIIINLSNTNIVNNSNSAVIKSDIANLKQELELYISNEYMNNLGVYDKKI